LATASIMGQRIQLMALLLLTHCEEVSARGSAVVPELLEVWFGWLFEGWLTV